MYAEFVKEYMGDEMLETDKSWAQYRFINETQCYIVNIWVNPECRKSGMAARLADEIVKAAKAKGCTELLGSAVPSTKTFAESDKILRAYGMKIKSATNDFVVYSKEI